MTGKDLSNCSCTHETTPTFWDIKTIFLPVGLLVYGIAVIVAYILHNWNQNSLNLSKEILSLWEKEFEEGQKELFYQRIKEQERKRNILRWCIRFFFLVSFIVSIIFSYYVPCVYDYFLVPWSVGTTVFSNLVLFPVLLWKKAEEGFFALQLQSNNNNNNNNIDSQIGVEEEEVEKAEEDLTTSEHDNLDAKLDNILQKIDELQRSINLNIREKELI